jgi:transcriptional regulator with GAF, ATPase, and Fis domain
MPDSAQKSLWRRWGTRGLLEWGSVIVLSALILVVSQGMVEIGERYQTHFYFGLFLTLLLASGRLALSAWEMKEWTETAPGPEPSARLSPKSLDTLVSLLNVSRAISQDVSLADLGQVIVDSCRDCFECDEVSLMMLDRDRQFLEVRAFAGHRDKHLIRNARVRLGESVAGRVAETRTPIILGEEVDPRKFRSFEAKVRKIHCAMVAPIIVKGRVVGVLNASSSDSNVTYTEDDLRILCILAEHAGIAEAKARETDRTVRLLRRIRKRSRRHPEPAPVAGNADGEEDHRSAA